MTDQQNTATAGDNTPGRPAPPRCDLWIGAEQRYRRSTEDVRHYLPGYRCPAHTPRALRGLPENPPGPGWPSHRTQEAK